MTPAETILARLDKVRRCESGPKGPSWMACCPSHEDKSPSLRVTEAQDDVALVYCTAGCKPGDILAAIGLGLSDLYPERLYADLPKKERKKVLDARQQLKALKREVLIVAIAAENLRQGIALDDTDRSRLWEAEGKIRKAAELCI